MARVCGLKGTALLSSSQLLSWRNARLPLEDIIRICMIRERGEYMCDFMADEQNHIVRINLNAVKDRAEDVVWDGVRADAGEETER